MTRPCVNFVLLLLIGGCCAKSGPKVIVVGAGASGIAAATRLLKNGIDDVTILEAENRIGGRINSVKFGDAYVDLGAQWCHGQGGNVVYELVKDLNILVSDKSPNPILVHSKLKVIDPGFAFRFLAIFFRIYGGDLKGVNETLGDYVTKKYSDAVEKVWSNDAEKLGVAHDALDLLEKMVLPYKGAFSWFSLAAHSDFVNSDGDQYLAWNGRGYKTILEVLMQKFPDPKNALPIDDKILLNKEVSEINWNSKVDGEEKVVVTCTDQTQFVADHVILTVSLGVLKNQHKSLIQPPLTDDKTRAVDQLGMDAIMKVMLYFEQPWWNNTFPGYAFLWSADDLTHSFEGPAKVNGKSWITALSFLFPVLGNPNVLSAWFTGPFIPEIERISDEMLVNGIMHVMSKFEVQTDPIRPQNVTRHGWYTNPHFRGTYSYDTLESHVDGRSKRTILSEPLATSEGNVRLLFAGEATDPTQYSSVHGAIRSGFREADRLLKIHS
ncbi:hypothetical protein FQR65_LT04994 [Abscondita terminalis]|nr:hypothetical protein FQR65_LT04994 [Abscondita terminalis]